MACYHELRIIKIDERKIHNISQNAYHLVILREAEGEDPESLIDQLTFSSVRRLSVTF